MPALRENADELQHQFVFDEAFLACRRNIDALRGDTARRRREPAGAGARRAERAGGDAGADRNARAR